MKHTILFIIAVLTLTSMTFKYDDKIFSFETTEELMLKEPSTSDWVDNIIFEQEFENISKDIAVTFRIIDFSIQGKILNPIVNDNKVLEIANDYVNDIKMTGQVQNIELPNIIQENWINFSAVLKLSKEQKSNNVFCLKRIDNWVLVISIGSMKTNADLLKVLVQKISATIKIAAP